MVLRLIEEGAGLLALEQVGLQEHVTLAVLDGLVDGAAEHALHQRQALVGADLDVVALDDGARTQQLLQQVGEGLAAQLGGLGERLDREAVGVAIDHQARQAVGLAVDEAGGVLALGVGAELLAQLDRALEAPHEERLVDRLLLAGEQAQRDLALLAIERLADEPAALVDHPHLRAAGEGRVRGHVGLVDPGVAGLQAREAVRADHYGGLAVVARGGLGAGAQAVALGRGRGVGAVLRIGRAALGLGALVLVAGAGEAGAALLDARRARTGAGDRGCGGAARGLLGAALVGSGAALAASLGVEAVTHGARASAR